MAMDVYSSLSVSRGLGKIRNFEYMVDEVVENHCPLLGKVKLFKRNTAHYSGKIIFFRNTVHYLGKISF